MDWLVSTSKFLDKVAVKIWMKQEQKCSPDIWFMYKKNKIQSVL